MPRERFQRVDLHSELKRRSYDHAFITTYEFTADFFEDYCLETLDALRQNSNVTVLVDARTYAGILDGPPGQRPRQANLRYLFHPVSVPAAFHPKLHLFASEKKGLLLVGSANFTRPGLTTNAELVGIFRFDADKDRQHQAVFGDAFRIIQQLCQISPSKELESNLEYLRREVPWLDGELEQPMTTALQLISNIDEPLLDQLRRHVEKPVRSVRIVSPFFDARPGLLDHIYESLDPTEVVIYTENGTTTMTPAWLDHATTTSGRTKILFGRYEDENHPQTLHAKGLLIEHQKGYTLAYGSANCTSAALLTCRLERNIEVIAVMDIFSKNALDSARIFDPNGTATPLKTKKDLITRRVDEERIASSAVWLHDARLLDRTIELTVTPPKEFHDVRWEAQLMFPDEGKLLLPVTCAGAYRTAPLADSIAQRVDKWSTVIRLRAIAEHALVAESNPRLLTNLQDIETGESVRKQRYVREAEHSSARFIAVLNELASSEDEEGMLTFLNLCNIPLRDGVRRIGAHGRPRWEDTGALRMLGERNLRIFTNLHEAAVDFVRRHMNRLERHSESPVIDRIANFMHIALAIAGVLRSQFERALSGLESLSRPLGNEEWYKARLQFDHYVRLFEDLMELMVERYVPALRKYYEPDRIRNALAPDLEMLREMHASILAIPSSLGRLCDERLQVLTPIGGKVRASFMKSNVFSWTRWPKHEEKLRAALGALDEIGAA